MGYVRDMTEIAVSIGEAGYYWDIESDVLDWSTNACSLLNIPDLAMIATGRCFGRFITPENTQSRFDAVMKSPVQDSGSRFVVELPLTN